jgi:hypothetical protein
MRGNIGQDMGNVDISLLKAGLYFIKIEGANIPYIQKIIKL